MQSWVNYEGQPNRTFMARAKCTNLDDCPQRIRNINEWLLTQALRDNPASHKPAMQRRDLTDDTGILQSAFDATDHIIDILTLLHEAEAALERDGTDDIERIPLQPDTKIDGFSLKIPHCFNKDIRAFIGEGLHSFDGRHGEFLRNRPLQSLMLDWIADGEHAGHDLVVVEWTECIIERGLKESVFNRQRMTEKAYSYLQELAANPIYQRNSRRV